MPMPHLALDIYGIADDLLGDEKLLHDLLDMLPTIISMQIVAGPFVYPFVHKANEASPEHATLDAISIIATSHIAIHTLPHHSLCLIDVFSCKAFDRRAVIDTVCCTFGVTPEQIEVHYTERAVRSPREAMLT